MSKKEPLSQNSTLKYTFDDAANNKKKGVCPKCKKEDEYKLILVDKKEQINGINVSFQSEEMYCKECSLFFSDENLEQNTWKKALKIVDTTLKTI